MKQTMKAGFILIPMAAMFSSAAAFVPQYDFTFTVIEVGDFDFTFNQTYTGSVFIETLGSPDVIEGRTLYDGLVGQLTLQTDSGFVNYSLDRGDVFRGVNFGDPGFAYGYAIEATNALPGDGAVVLNFFDFVLPGETPPDVPVFWPNVIDPSIFENQLVASLFGDPAQFIGVVNTWEPIPEPATMLALGAGAGLMALRRRRKQK